MYLVPQSVFHLGTDQLQQVNQKILLQFKQLASRKELKIDFKFDVSIDNNMLQNDIIHENFDIIIFAVGRYGTSLMNTFKSGYIDNQKIIESSNTVDIGIRFELSSMHKNIHELDTALYEWKIKYKTKNNMFVRTFCHNPMGYVVTQNVNVLGEQVAIANGHSRKDSKSTNTNFAILVTQKFTEPFDNSVLYGKIISQQANLLAGSNDKVILQTLGDFLNKKRTKHLFRVQPTLSKDKYVLGDLTYALPARTYEAIVEFLLQLGQVIPEILIDDNLLYGIEAKFYSMKMINTKKYKFIGDCSGRSRSIISAACMGYNLVDQILRK